MNKFKKKYAQLFELYQSKCSSSSTTSSLAETATSPTTVIEVAETPDPGELVIDDGSEWGSQSQITTTSVNPAAYTKLCLDFTEFIACFNHSKFDFVLGSTLVDRSPYSLNLYRELFAEINEYLLVQLAGDKPIERQVFSFYLMYALWFQQHAMQIGLNIRVDRPGWVRIKSFVDKCKLSQTFEVVLCFRRLFRAGAFAFCENLLEYGPDSKGYLLNRQKHEQSNDSQSEPKTNKMILQLDEYLKNVQALNLIDVHSCDNLKRSIINYETS